MELLSNLAWTVIIVAMLGAWLASRRRLSRTRMLPGIGVQIIAFAMVSAILLPAVSMTDDLHACAIPAEVERTCGWHHRMLASMQTTHNLPVALALLSSLLHPAGLRAIALRAAKEPITHPPFDSGQKLWSRPPPCA